MEKINSIALILKNLRPNILYTFKNFKPDEIVKNRSRRGNLKKLSYTDKI